MLLSESVDDIKEQERIHNKHRAVSAYNGTIAITSPCDTQGLSFSVKGQEH